MGLIKNLFFIFLLLFPIAFSEIKIFPEKLVLPYEDVETSIIIFNLGNQTIYYNNTPIEPCIGKAIKIFVPKNLNEINILNKTIKIERSIKGSPLEIDGIFIVTENCTYAERVKREKKENNLFYLLFLPIPLLIFILLKFKLWKKQS